MYWPTIEPLLPYELNFYNKIFAECAPGYYGTGAWCQLCPFNRIKPQPGNTNECSMQCDFINALHNPQHTACREFFHTIFRFGDIT